jgi:hypothetical protein
MGILAGSGDTGKAFAHQIVLEGVQTSESLETNPREGLLDIHEIFSIFFLVPNNDYVILAGLLH